MAPPVPGAGSHVRAGPAPPILDLRGGPGTFTFTQEARERGGLGRGSAPSGLLPNPWCTWPGCSSRVPTLPPCASRPRVTEGARPRVQAGRCHLTPTLCETPLSETY
uniref:Uncharacterized protein n=1 Tax=Peromyscus maniculatus bairdii TaxID=230844 RepID=A0A8C8W265_PERMB